MDENTILSSIVDLHQAVYDYMLPIQNDISGLEILGFGSSRERPELPALGIRVNLRSIQVDRLRPTPSAGNPVLVPSEEKKDYEYEGILYEDVPVGFTYKHPLPVLLQYEFNTWCYFSKDQIAIDHAILSRFPERGVLYLPIDSVEYQFPIELLGIENLDDLKQNFRERLYRFAIEAWIKSPIQDAEAKVITTSLIEVYQGKEITDLEDKLMEIVDQAEEIP